MGEVKFEMFEFFWKFHYLTPSVSICFFMLLWKCNLQKNKEL